MDLRTGYDTLKRTFLSVDEHHRSRSAHVSYSHMHEIGWKHDSNPQNRGEHVGRHDAAGFTPCLH